MIIAIDGPSGVGKGTVSREVARQLGYRHIDTGSMYRGVAWRALQEGLSLEEEEAVTALARRIVLDAGDGKLAVDGVDISGQIRTSEMDLAASRVARIPGVRTAMVQRQRELGVSGRVVMEGRDIGTVVFPDAPVKIYLDAAAEERARRRAGDAAHQGATDMATLARQMAARDHSDRNRTVSPLAPAADAHIIDTTGLSIGQVVGRVMEIVARTGS
jgi:cytidylate kinase